MRPLHFSALVALALPLFTMLAPVAAQADPYKWCANYTGDAGGASNCGFVTREQCMATVSGIGGSCDLNQFYTGPEPTRSRATRRVRHPQG